MGKLTRNFGGTYSDFRKLKLLRLQQNGFHPMGFPSNGMAGAAGGDRLMSGECDDYGQPIGMTTMSGWAGGRAGDRAYDRRV